MAAFAVVSAPVAGVYAAPGGSAEQADELLHGFVCQVLSESGGWAHIRSHYGYEGYVDSAALRFSYDAARRSALRVIDAPFLDVLTRPEVRAERLSCLPRGALVAAPPARTEPGWRRVRLADGREGYARETHLAERRFADDYRDFSFSALLNRFYGGSEEAFRARLIAEAEGFLGAQYRWGGRSSFGVDCSGLVSLAYMLAGVNIFRDARIEAGYPICEIRDAPRPGDLLYFPGHVAMYLGNGSYIHATAHPDAGGVVINSLRPDDSRYRQDLRESLYAVGGLRR